MKFICMMPYTLCLAILLTSPSAYSQQQRAKKQTQTVTDEAKNNTNAIVFATVAATGGAILGALAYALLMPKNIKKQDTLLPKETYQHHFSELVTFMLCDANASKDLAIDSIIQTAEDSSSFKDQLCQAIPPLKENPAICSDKAQLKTILNSANFDAVLKQLSGSQQRLLFYNFYKTVKTAQMKDTDILSYEDYNKLLAFITKSLPRLTEDIFAAKRTKIMTSFALHPLEIVFGAAEYYPKFQMSVTELPAKREELKQELANLISLAYDSM